MHRGTREPHRVPPLCVHTGAANLQPPHPTENMYAAPARECGLSPEATSVAVCERGQCIPYQACNGAECEALSVRAAAARSALTSALCEAARRKHGQLHPPQPLCTCTPQYMPPTMHLCTSTSLPRCSQQTHRPPPRHQSGHASRPTDAMAQPGRTRQASRARNTRQESDSVRRARGIVETALVLHHVDGPAVVLHH